MSSTNNIARTGDGINGNVDEEMEVDAAPIGRMHIPRKDSDASNETSITSVSTPSSPTSNDTTPTNARYSGEIRFQEKLDHLIGGREVRDLPWHGICLGMTDKDPLPAVAIMRRLRGCRKNLETKKKKEGAKEYLDTNVYNPLIQELRDHQQNHHGLEAAPGNVEELLFVKAFCNRNSKRVYLNYRPSGASVYRNGDYYFEAIEFEDAKARDALVIKYLNGKQYSSASNTADTSPASEPSPQAPTQRIPELPQAPTQRVPELPFPLESVWDDPNCDDLFQEDTLPAEFLFSENLNFESTMTSRSPSPMATPLETRMLMNEDIAPALPPFHYHMIDSLPAPEVSVHVDSPRATESLSLFCLRTFCSGKRVLLDEYCHRHGIMVVHDNFATRNMDVLLRCAEAAGNDMTDEKMVRHFFDFVNLFWPKDPYEPFMDVDDDDDSNDDDNPGHDDNHDEDYDDSFSDEKTCDSEDKSDSGSYDGDGYDTGASLMKSPAFRAANVVSCDDALDTAPCVMSVMDGKISAVPSSIESTYEDASCPLTSESEHQPLLSDVCASMGQLSLLEDENKPQVVTSAVLEDPNDISLKNEHGRKFFGQDHDSFTSRNENSSPEISTISVNSTTDSSTKSTVQVDVEPQTADAWTALHFAKDVNGWVALHFASDMGLLDMVRCLVQEGKADVNAKNSNGWTALHWASHRGHLKVIQYLVREGKVYVNAQNNNGQTALHFASDQGHLEMVQCLVREGKTNVNARNSNGRTALHYASDQGHLEVVQYLVLEGKADVNAQNKNGWTALHFACDKGHLKVVEYLVQEGKAFVNAKNNNGRTALHLANYKGLLEMVRYLVREGKANVNAPTNDAWTALHFASDMGLLDMVRCLVQEGKADVNAQTNDGWTALHWASHRGHLEVIQYLVREGKVYVNAQNNNGQTALHFASDQGHLEMVQCLVREGNADVNAQEKDGWTPLHVASLRGHLEMVQFILREGKADVNAQNNDGWTALHSASDQGLLEMVQYLVQEGKVDVNAQNSKGWTALHLASDMGHMEVVQCLVREGKADVSAQTNDGWTALRFANDKGLLEMVQYLEREGKADFLAND